MFAAVMIQALDHSVNFSHQQVVKVIVSMALMLSGIRLTSTLVVIAKILVSGVGTAKSQTTFYVNLLMKVSLDFTWRF